MTLKQHKAINLLLILTFLGTLNAIDILELNEVNLDSNWKQLLNFLEQESDKKGDDITTNDYQNMVVMQDYFGIQHHKNKSLNVLFKNTHVGKISNDPQLSAWIKLQNAQNGVQYVPEIVSILRVKNQGQIIVVYKRTKGSLLSGLYDNQFGEQVPDSDLVEFLANGENKLAVQAHILDAMEFIESNGYHNCSGSDDTFHYMPTNATYEANGNLKTNQNDLDYNIVYTDFRTIRSVSDKCQVSDFPNSSYLDYHLVIENEDFVIEESDYVKSSRFSTGLYLIVLEAYFWSALYETGLDNSLEINWFTLPDNFDSNASLFEKFKMYYEKYKNQSSATFPRIENFNKRLQSVENVDSQSWITKLFNGDSPIKSAPTRFIVQLVKAIIEEINGENPERVEWDRVEWELRYLGDIFKEGMSALNSDYNHTYKEDDEQTYVDDDYEIEFNDFPDQALNHMRDSYQKIIKPIINLMGFISARNSFAQVASEVRNVMSEFQQIRGLDASKVKEVMEERRLRRLVLV